MQTNKKECSVKILFIVSNLIVGGVEKVCYEIVQHIDRKKFSIDFLVAVDEYVDQYYEPLMRKMGCNIYKGGYIYNTKDKNKFLQKEGLLIETNEYDVVHSHMDYMNIWTLKVAKEKGVKIRISHVHTTFSYGMKNNIKAEIKYLLQKYLMNKYATVLIGCSRKANQDFYGNYKALVLYNGMDLMKFSDLKEDKCERSFIHIGRMDKLKNPLFLCETMKELVRFDSDIKLYWIGEGVYHDKVVNYIRSNQLESNIMLIGATTNILPWLKKARYAIFPSECEGLGIAAIETQISGTFSFCSDGFPQEVDLGFVKFISLNEGAKKWAEEIYGFVVRNSIADYSVNNESVSKFDIRYSVAVLEKLYEGETVGQNSRRSFVN